MAAAASAAAAPCPIKVVRTSTRTHEGVRRIFYVLQVADGAMVNRQYEEFRAFEKAWKAIYPTLEAVSLGSMVTDALSLFKPEDKRKEQRKQQLADYLAKVWEVAALRPMLAEFLEVDKARLGLVPAAAAATAAAAGAGAGAGGEDDGPKGNTMAASRAAQRDKERFLEQHAHVLDKLMPDHDRRFANLASAQTKSKSIFRAAPAGERVVVERRDAYPETTVLCAWEADPAADEATEFLSVREGEVLQLVDAPADEQWWYGENSAGVGGYFPATYAASHPSHAWYVPLAKHPPAAAGAARPEKQQRRAAAWRTPPEQEEERPPRLPPKPKLKPKPKPQQPAKVATAAAEAMSPTSVAELRKRFQQ